MTTLTSRPSSAVSSQPLTMAELINGCILLKTEWDAMLVTNPNLPEELKAIGGRVTIAGSIKFMTKNEKNLQAEIERLKGVSEARGNELVRMDTTNRNLKAEIARMQSAERAASMAFSIVTPLTPEQIAAIPAAKTPSNPATVGSGIANVYDISNAKIPAGSLTNTAQLTPEQIAALKNVGADVRQNGLTKDEDMIRELRKRLDEQAILTLSAKVKALEALVTPRTESSES